METTDITRERIKKYLEEGKRFDNRKFEEYRELKIETGISKNAEGSARVKLGKTEVLVGIKMNIGEPYPDSPDQGNLMVTAELLPLSSPRFELGPPKFPAIELARVLDRAVRESKLIDTKKLCVKKGEKVWTVFIDVYSINDDGNLMDAAGFGILAALKNAKIPKYDEKEEKVLHEELTNKSLPLNKEILPISITVHKIGNNLIVDPTLEEEDISETRITMGLSEKAIHSMQKGENKELDLEEFNAALELGTKARKAIFKKLEKYL